MTNQPTLLEQLTEECHNKLMAYEYEVTKQRIIDILKDKHWISELTIGDAQDLTDIMEDQPFPLLDVGKLFKYINK